MGVLPPVVLRGQPRARQSEERSRLLAVFTLALPVVSCLLAAVSGAAVWVGAAAGATGVSVSLSKFALDAAVQQHVAPRFISTAFARSETALPVLGLVLARQLALAKKR